MSSYHCRGKRKTILPIHFSAIIFKKIDLERLKISSKFTSRYGGGLSNPVFVKPPDGTKWKAFWTKQNGEVWLEKGWKEFTENYSLDHGHLLVFTYDGTSQLDVHIYDKSASEIDYPLCNTCDEKNNLDQSDDESLEILKETPPLQKAIQNLPSFSSQPRKRMRGENTERTSSLNWPKEPRAQEVAKKFVSYNPFFTMFIRHVHVAEYKVCVPSLKGYVENKEKDVMLQIGKRSWAVKMRRCHSPTARRLSAGWSLFAHESELHPGDVCIFELINMEDSVFRVHIFKKQG